MIAAAFRYDGQLYYREMKESDSISFGSGSRDTVYVQGMKERQLSVREKNGEIIMQTKAPFTPAEKKIPIGTVEQIDSSSGASLFTSRVTGTAEEKFPLPLNGIVRCGRAAGNDICIALPFVSGSHFQLRLEDGSIRAEDLSSTNGMFVNGRKVSAAKLRSGDTIHILTVCIRVVNRSLEFDNVGNALHISEQTQPDGNVSDAAPADTSAGKILRYRLSPRLQSELPQEPIVLDRPPQKGQEYHPSGRFADLLSLGEAAGETLTTVVASPVLAFAKAAELALSVRDVVAEAKQDKKRQAAAEDYNRKREETYKSYITAQRARIAAVAGEQRAIRTEENPSPDECLSLLAETSHRIWERRSCDRDFLDVRIGMGYEKLCVPIRNYAENRGLLMEDDEMEALCNQIAEESELVDYIPRRLPLRSTPTIGVFGNRDQVIHTVRNMIVSLTTLHSPNDVRLVGIFDNSERTRWSALRWLPHIWDSSSQFRYLAFDRERARQICAMLCDELGQRVNAGGVQDAAQQPIPHYVILLGSRELVEDEPLLELLSAEHQPIGATTFFLFDELCQMPRDCGSFLDLTQEFPYYYDRYHANKRAAFSRDHAVDSVSFNSFARKMAALELAEQSRSKALPSSITFLDGCRANSIADLQILRRWNANKVCDSLCAPIGILPDGSDFVLDLHAHAHGLIAGAAGSGKSELLRTWILSMAVNYHPHAVNFVIIDCKGSGLANRLAALPHVVGSITDNDGDLSRALVSLRREVKRRVTFLEKFAGTDSIDRYMQLYYAGKAAEPMPHLILVCDDFAELRKEEPEFAEGLSALARSGRNVGIHLVTAAQRPAYTADDPLHSIARFRICLRVGSVQESKEMISCPDAAGITQRGRAYVRLGEDGKSVLMQTFWSGAVCPQETAQQYPDLVRIVDVSGERLRRKESDTVTDGQSDSDQLTAVVSAIAAIAADNGIKRRRGPWLPPLPGIVPTDCFGAAVRFDGTGWREGFDGTYRVPIGIFDRPAAQEQGVQVLDFSQTPHYAVCGAPRSGKTTFLKTLILSLGLCFSPDEVSITVFDFGSGSLTACAQMPHTASVIREGNTAQTERFCAFIDDEIQKRRACFRNENTANFAEYIRRKHGMPAIFILIDNLLRLKAISPETEAFLSGVSMNGAECGIHLVFTGSEPDQVNLQANIGGRIALHLPDPHDYRTVVTELPEGCGLPVNPGRGLIRDTAAAAFQTAVYNGDHTAEPDALFSAMREAYSRSAPADARRKEGYE